MDIDSVREALHRVPFQPFAMRLADGRSFTIRHRDFVALGKRRIVVVHEDDTSSFVEPLLIVSLDELPTRGGSNGKGRSRKNRPS
jgi:hypothetical protein